MALKTSGIDSYLISYRSAWPTVAYIHCYRSGKKVGMLIFVKEGEPVPQNKITKSTGTSDEILNIHFPISRFNDIISILRYREASSIRSEYCRLEWSIGTGSEPIGEEEP